MRVLNKNSNMLLADEVIIANTFMTRLKGLMFKRSLVEGNVLMIKPCNSIHTFFMKFPIDIIFLSKGNVVIHVIENMIPGKISPFVKGAISVLELQSGIIRKTETKKGDLLEIL
ncbi:DUF192 domain-containing protein [Clostridium saccharoperbutylacetonicum]|uniref:DUF192 domain-containing protein n=1 Tax=Clostridium saccharoperbutylacetonicum TaxID=36745 RepID=UPI0039ECC327